MAALRMRALAHMITMSYLVMVSNSLILSESPYA